MGVKFTDDQQRVIDTRDRNILVAAAAGSGKTAVLVERIIQKICDENKPVDIDRLLIVTFTSAAAAQMRERISKAVQAKLDEQPESEALYEHLQKQSALIHNAQITTIDSFCLFIIRNNFNEIGLDPGFRVADEGEVKLIEKDTLDSLLEDKYAQADSRFLRFSESYSTGVKEEKIEEAILKLYHFSMSTPFPEEWLMERKNDYKITSPAALVEQKWFKRAIKYMRTILDECALNLIQAKNLATGAGGPIHYMENLEDDCCIIDKLRDCKTYQELYDGFTYTSFTDLSRKRPQGVDPDIREATKKLRDSVKKSVEEIRKFMFQISPEDTFNDMSACDEMVEELVDLTLDFKERLDKAKRESNIVDFSDMEHFALQILLEKDEEGQLKLRDTARDLMDHFEEIMIDEYQDSNEVQELLLKSISGEANGRHNRFMVGDVKQSIYKFRLARPEIFMDKYDTYSTQDMSSDNVRIDLSMNFRSRKEVTESSNFICGQLMKKEVGNVEYDKAAALYVGASYKDAVETGGSYETELLLACDKTNEDDANVVFGYASDNSEDGDEDDDYNAKEKEAIMVADRINELVGSFPVTDGNTGDIRPAKYSDIVILFRATAGWDEDFRRILNDRGIPVHVTSKTGYFKTMEIQGIVNMLRVLDNPLQDIPFFGMMKLPYFDFSDEEIAKIRCLDKAFLYEQVCEYIQESEKAKNLISFIEKYRRKQAYTPIKQLIQEILVETGYALYVAAMPAGEQRYANVELLLEKAGAFEKTSFYGLFHFIRYLETIENQDVDFGEANILDENADVVRIMTIHKSKGLEFPICFVCGLSKKFNTRDFSQSILSDVELGVGVDYIDPVNRLKRKTFRKNVVAKCMKEESRGEDLRVLYVALTRAKEKLILTGHVEDLKKLIKEHIDVSRVADEKLSYSTIMDASCYMDLIIPSLIRHVCMKDVIELQGFEFIKYDLPYCEIPMKVVLWHESIVGDLTKEIKEVGRAEALEADLDRSSELMDVNLGQRLKEKLNYKYSHDELAGLTVKVTVSELKKHGYEEALEAKASKELVSVTENELCWSDNDEEDSKSSLKANKEPVYIPKFMSETEQMLGTQYGTAVHKVCELLSFDENKFGNGISITDMKANVDAERKQWISDGRVTEKDIACVGTDKIVRFLESSLAKRMATAASKDNLFKEQPFVIGRPASEINDKFPDSETVLIQGVIDVFFIEDGGIVLADYKTDRVNEEQELVARYKTQLDNYQKALEQLTGKTVKERYIYSFKLNKEIKL